MVRRYWSESPRWWMTLKRKENLDRLIQHQEIHHPRQSHLLPFQTDLKSSRSTNLKPKQKPVAYYLPVSNAAPLRIGILNQPGSLLNKENRSILANYMAGINTEMKEIEKKKSQRKEEKVVNSRENHKSTLQEALSEKNPDFIRKAENRRLLLRDHREQRLRVEERKRRWIEQMESVVSWGKTPNGAKYTKSSKFNVCSTTERWFKVQGENITNCLKSKTRSMRTRRSRQTGPNRGHVADASTKAKD